VRPKARKKEAFAALETVCGMYWYPIYAFLRRSGHPPSNAEDITQSFFHMVVVRNLFAEAKAERGRLRSFLLASLKRHLADEYRHRSAQKRGGGVQFVSIEHEEDEARFGNLPATNETPERIYDRACAEQLLRVVSQKVREKYARIGKAELFDAIEPYLSGSQKGMPYRTVAEKLDMPEPTLRSQVLRMRRRYRAVLEEEITASLQSPEDLPAEIGHLMRIFDAGE